MIRKLLWLWSPLVVAWLLGFGGLASLWLSGTFLGPDHWLPLWSLVAYLASAPIGALGFVSAVAAVVMALRIDRDAVDLTERNVLWLNAPMLLAMTMLWMVLHGGVIGSSFLFMVG